MESQQPSAQQQPAGTTSTDSSARNRRGRLAKERLDRMKDKVPPVFNWIGMAIFGVAMVVVGSLAFGKCPVEPYIPLFLVGAGAVLFLATCTDVVNQYLNGQNKEDTIRVKTALFAVQIMLFILGSYWVYKEYPPSYEPNDGDKYCQKTAYLFAFIYITIGQVAMVVTITSYLCFLLCIYFVVGTAALDEDVEANLRSEEANAHAEVVPNV